MSRILLLCSSLFSSTVPVKFKSLGGLSILSVSSHQLKGFYGSTCVLPYCTRAWKLEAMSFGNHRAPLICLPSLSDQCYSLPDMQYLENYSFIYLFSFLVVNRQEDKLNSCYYFLEPEFFSTFF